MNPLTDRQQEWLAMARAGSSQQLGQVLISQLAGEGRSYFLRALAQAYDAQTMRSQVRAIATNAELGTTDERLALIAALAEPLPTPDEEAPTEQPSGLHSFVSQEDDLDLCAFCGQGPNSAVHRHGAPR